MRSVFIPIAALSWLAAVASPARAQQLDAYVRAQTAFMSHRLADAEAAYREALAGDTLPDHRHNARLSLATLAWRVRHDTLTAHQLLTIEARTARERVALLIEHARMLQSLGAWEGARSKARQALAAAASMPDSASATLAFARSVIEPAVRLRLGWDGGAAVPDTLLALALHRLRALVTAFPGELEPARLLVTVAALTGDMAALAAGWRSYYLVEIGDTTRGPLAAPRSVINAILRTGETITPGSSERLAGALADSRMFVPAAVIAAGRAAEGPREREITAYAAYLAAVQDVTDEFYRLTLLRGGDAGRWRDSLERLGTALWPHLDRAGSPPPFSPERLNAELDRRFGATWNLGATGGYADLHFGHRVVEERRTVTQYGHTARFRFAELDGMVSNGFQSWAWDGRSAHGGWQTGDLIIQIRPEYTRAPLVAWRTLTDSAARRRFDVQIAADSAADILRGRANPVTYFPSVGRRMQRDAWQGLYDSLRAAGLGGHDLEMAFERIIDRDVQESSIFAHEGRHAIDKSSGWLSRLLHFSRPLDSPELEFRAKLSQVVFAPRPRLGIPTIVDATVGDNTPHGQADARVMRGLLAWMTAHAAEIRGLDASLPLLPQLPLLSDAQLRAACRSLDPMRD